MNEWQKWDGKERKKKKVRRRRGVGESGGVRWRRENYHLNKVGVGMKH